MFTTEKRPTGYLLGKSVGLEKLKIPEISSTHRKLHLSPTVLRPCKSIVILPAEKGWKSILNLTLCRKKIVFLSSSSSLVFRQFLTIFLPLRHCLASTAVPLLTLTAPTAREAKLHTKNISVTQNSLGSRRAESSPSPGRQRGTGVAAAPQQRPTMVAHTAPSRVPQCTPVCCLHILLPHCTHACQIYMCSSNTT